MAKMSRRSFLKAFGIGVAGAVVASQLPELPTTQAVASPDINKKDFRAYFGWRRSGKTTQLVQSAVDRFQDGDNILVFTPNYPMSLYFMERVQAELEIRQNPYSYEKGRAIYTPYKNEDGAIVFLHAAGQSYRGMSPDTVIVDEIGWTMSKRDFEHKIIPMNPDRIYVSYDKGQAMTGAIEPENFFSGAWDTYSLD